MKRAYFITGTDTGVGKTFITVLLAKTFKERGFRVGVMKPVETGCGLKNGMLLPSDALMLKRASGCISPLDAINPYRFGPPLAPAVAAGMEGRKIDFKIIKKCFTELSKIHDIMLVEGAGGLLTPVSGYDTMADLARFLGLKIIIVAASRLGAINHTLLTAECAVQRGLKAAGIILNDASGSKDTSKGFNLGEIEKLSRVPILGEVPFAGKKKAPSGKGGLCKLTSGLKLNAL